METQHLMTDNRKRPGEEKKKGERKRRKKDTDKERWREKAGDLVVQKKQFSIGGQRET